MGMNTISSPKKVLPNQATDMRDMVAKAGLLSTRDGILKYNTTSYGLPITGLYDYTPRYASVKAGADQIKDTGDTVTLDGSDSVNALSYLWTQIIGTTVVLSDPTGVNTTFTMPSGDVSFSLETTNPYGSNTDTVYVINSENLISISIYDDGATSPLLKNGRAVLQLTENDAWSGALVSWNSATYAYEPRFAAMAYNLISGGGTNWRATIRIFKVKLTADLTAYNPTDYEVANLVIKPTTYGGYAGITSYYNDQGWIENYYNFLKDIKSELGNVWTSTELYAPNFTPLRPPANQANGYWAQEETEGYQGFYIALIPKT